MKAQVLCLISLCSVANAISGYYWKDYYTKIPSDAVPGGDDDGNPMYIGQAYIHSHGVFVMQILPGRTNPDVAVYGIKKPTNIQKILCSKHPEYFSWMTTTAKTFHLDVTGKHAVIGGFDHVDANRGMLHVGRLAYQGTLRIGSVLGYTLENAVLFFNGGTTEQKATNYEVLLFDAAELVSSKDNSSICVY